MGRLSDTRGWRRGQVRGTGVLLAEVQSHFLEGLFLLVANLLQLCLLLLELPQLLKRINQTPDTWTFFFLLRFSDHSNKQDMMLFKSKKSVLFYEPHSRWSYFVDYFLPACFSRSGDCKVRATGVALRWGHRSEAGNSSVQTLPLPGQTRLCPLSCWGTQRGHSGTPTLLSLMLSTGSRPRLHQRTEGTPGKDWTHVLSRGDIGVLVQFPSWGEGAGPHSSGEPGYLILAEGLGPSGVKVWIVTWRKMFTFTVSSLASLPPILTK